MRERSDTSRGPGGGGSRRSRTSRLREQGGFTLVELLSSVATVLLVLLASLAMFEFVQRSQPEISERNAALQKAQVEIERMVRDLRQAYSVVSASPAALTVLTYDSGASCAAGGTGPSRECRLTYTCTAGRCTRTMAEADGTAPGTAGTLIDGLASSEVFSYSPSAAAPTTVLIRFEMPAEGGGEDAVTLEEGVTLRNLPVVE